MAIACIGVCGIDMLAYVGKFPNPDDKVRTLSSLKAGGGNCGNTATALALLGAEVSVLSCVGDDADGSHIIAELNGSGVNTSAVVTREGASPFTYVLVDNSTSTRTCIHTPG